MPNPSPDLEKMQRDAERRIKEMQQRSERAVHGGDMPPVPNFVRMGNQPNRNGTQRRSNQLPKAPAPEQKPKPAPQKPPPPKNDGILGRFKGLDILKLFNFQNLHIDGDVLIIIALIFLLSTEETDELLLLALVYIML